MIELGFLNSKVDTYMYKFHSSSTTVVLVCVDDIIIIDSDDVYICDLIQLFNQKFSLKDLGPLHFFLGIEVKKIKEGLHLCQHKYIKHLLDKISLE